MRYPFLFTAILSVFIAISMQGCTSIASYGDTELEDFEKNQKRMEARKRVDSASKTRTVPNPHPTKSLINAKPNGGG